ncbi:MAG: winged helix-turn-helix domain-containing protein [Pseudohongiella sp.]|uniref:transcriptional regulator n=1 Tax=Pseudohongiella sp. TaxID=1979412 RepID=UPI00349FE047
MSESNTQPDPAENAVSYAALISCRAFVLDCWHVYPTRNLIRFRGDAGEAGGGQAQQQVEPRLMRLLCLLAASAESVVSRDDIISVLWPRVVVNENSLTRAVSDLRRCLTPPGANRTALIQTIPKRGYRLTRTPTVVDAHSVRPLQSRRPGDEPTLPPSGKTAAGRWITRWTPSIAACFILALALVLRVSDDGQSRLPVAQLPTDPAFTADAQHVSPPVYDRVIGSSGHADSGLGQDARALPTNLAESAAAPLYITRLGNAPENALQTLQRPPATDLRPGQAMLTPDGQLLAYVEFRDGISSLNLRPALTDADPWVAFTTDERIFNLQWSPLDAGILLTVGQSAENKDQASYLRLLLLDMETLSLQELYRRELPHNRDWPGEIGNLT